MTRPAVGTMVILVAALIGPAVLAYAPAHASTARWSSMQTPAVLGRDDASIEVFPAILAEGPPGLYGDAVESSRFLLIPKLGETRLVVGATSSDEIRIGAAGWSLRGVVMGAQGLYSHSSTEAKYEADNGAPASDRSVSRDLVAASAGFLVGAPEGFHLDGALQLGLDLAEGSEGRASESYGWQRYEIEPRKLPTWRLAGMASAPLGGGFLRAFVEGGRNPRESRVTKWYEGEPGPPYSILDSGTSQVGGTIGWVGSLKEISLLSCGISAAHTRATDVGQSVGRGRKATVRQVTATLFAGAELWIRPWVAARAGVSRPYVDEKETAELVRVEPDGSRLWSTDVKREGGFGSTLVTTGVGLNHRHLAVDLEFRLDYALFDFFRRASFSYLF